MSGHPPRLLAAAALATLIACSSARDVAGEQTAGGVADCTRCHGGAENATGAPPVTLRQGSAGAHSAHVVAGDTAGAFGCSACHPDPRVAPGPHLDGSVQVTFGALATAGGTLDARYDPATGTCSSVYCHGGAAAAAPTWTGGPSAGACGACHAVGTPPPPGHPGGLALADCASCHPATVSAGGGLLVAGGRHVDGTVQATLGAETCSVCHGQGTSPIPATHPPLAPGLDVGKCSVCHPGTVAPDGTLVAGGAHLSGAVDTRPEANHPGGWPSPDQHGAGAAQEGRACLECHAARGAPKLAATVCATCHDVLAGGDWTVTCTTCHGDPARPDGAPPVDLAGGSATTAVGVGAHQAHVAAPGELSRPLDCVFCHRKPADVFAEGHLDGAVTVTGYTGGDGLFAGALATSGWDRGTATCTNYCHSTLPNGNAANLPIWTSVGAGEAACGTCHGLPPGGTHPAVASDLATCNACHPETVSAAGALVPPLDGGRHLDGAIHVVSGHDAAWMDGASPGFHAVAAGEGLASCQVCHGGQLQGTGFGESCARCHDVFAPPPPGGTFVANCTACHGRVDNQTGAPPRTTWGRSADPVRVGAHTAHVESATAPVACATCHVVPADALSAAHVDGGTAELTFSGLAAQGTSPTWTRSTATCASTYCHGAGSTGGTSTAPSWTGGPAAAACGSCHGVPPAESHPPVGSSLTGCNPCHPDTVQSDGTLRPRASGGLHVDGAVQFSSGHGPAWMTTTSPEFHAYSANGGLASCQYCHGAALEGSSGAQSCASCHDPMAPTAPTFVENCTACHGDRPSGRSAPPRTTWGKSSDPIRTGAHVKHLAPASSRPAPCASCHVVPASALSPDHVSGTFAGVTFSGLATQGTAAATWSRDTARCSATYCHGATLAGGQNKAPLWTGGATQAACTSCHGNPPSTGTGTCSGCGNRGHSQHGRWCGNCHGNSSTSTVEYRPPAVRHVDGKVNVIITGYDLSTPEPCDTAVIELEGAGNPDKSWNCGACHNLLPMEGDGCF